MEETYPGNEYRALVAELDGDWLDAARYRTRVLKIMDRLIAKGRFEEAQLGMDDYADQLDMQALNYLDAGRTAEAWKSIRRSRRVCEKAGIPFDGQDIWDDIAEEMAREQAAGAG